MSHIIPQIHQFMTPNPKFVLKSNALSEVAIMMKKEGIRHLPVIYNGKIADVLSLSDIDLVTSVLGADIDKMTVKDAYMPHPMIVSKEAPLDQVCRAMAEHKLGCVLVEDKNNLVGIFTWIDALVAIDSLFHTELH